MSGDVRDILEINQEKQTTKLSKKKKIKRLIEPIKRPQGVHREVWGLICKDDLDQPPLIPAEEPKIYKHPKAKLRYGVRKWHWVEFKNPARTDSATFSHWRCVNDDPNKEYPFAKYNKQIQLTKYTDSEYAQHLKDENWSKEETDYLFELCHRFDLRFFVVHDRWDSDKFENGKKRTIDELKDRYYKVTGVLQKLKTGDDSQIYVFDLEHEQKRREQLEKLFNRTKEQVDEELYLIEELKKIEIRKKEREKKQQDVNKLLTAVVDLENSNRLTIGIGNQNNLLKNRNSIDNRSSLTNSLNGTSSNNKQRTKQRKLSANQSDALLVINNGIANSKSLSNSTGGLANSLGSNKSSGNLNNSLNNSQLANNSNNSLASSLDSINNILSPTSGSSNLIGNIDSKSSIKKPLMFKTVVESTGIKFPDNKLSGVSLRSYKMKLPQSVGLKKIKAIEQLLDELQIEHKPIATENICDQFNELRSDIVLLYDLQQALTSCDYELQTFRHRYESVLTAKSVDMSIFDTTGSTSSLLNSLSSANTPQKRISEIFDVSVTPSGPLERRRKAALNQTNLIKRLRGRNAT